jgi:hypothetical protein
MPRSNATRLYSVPGFKVGLGTVVLCRRLGIEPQRTSRAASAIASRPPL